MNILVCIPLCIVLRFDYFHNILIPCHFLSSLTISHPFQSNTPRAFVHQNDGQMGCALELKIFCCQRQKDQIVETSQSERANLETGSVRNALSLCALTNQNWSVDSLSTQEWFPAGQKVRSVLPCCRLSTWHWSEVSCWRTVSNPDRCHKTVDYWLKRFYFQRQWIMLRAFVHSFIIS